MKLLFVTHNFPFPAEKDGHTLIAFQLLTQLASRHQITLYCFGDQTDTVNISKFSDLGIEVRLFRRPRASLLGYYARPVSRRMAWYQYRLYSHEFANAFRSADHDKTYDLVYLHSPMVSWYLNCFLYTPVVLGAIDSMSAWYNHFRRYERNWLKQLHYAWEYAKSCTNERQLYPKAQQVIVVSPNDRTTILDNSPANRVSVIANGVDSTYYRPSSTPPDPRTIITSGTMNFPSNTQAVLLFYKEAWPKLKESFPDLKWIIAGKNPTLDIFEIPHHDPSITVTGYVKDLRPYLWQSAVYVSPLRLGTGCKNVLLEALACGKAVVAPPKSWAALQITPCHNVIQADTYQDFITQTSRLLNDRALREQLELAARSLAEQYSWTNTVNQYERVFTEARSAPIS